MADISVEQKPAVPLWTALLGLSALIVLVWMLFMLGADGATADSQTAELRNIVATLAA